MSPQSPVHKLQVLWITLSGLAMMVACMGIGRFAYTPLLPQMQAELGWTLSQAGDVASANFLGYLVGALMAAQLSQQRSRAYWLMLGLLGSAFTTLWGAVLSGAALPTLPVPGSTALNLRAMLDGQHLLWSWMALRFFSGVFSAFCLVIGTPIIMDRLGDLGLGQSRLLGGAHFAGVGAGIVLTVVLVFWWPSAGTRGLPVLARQWAMLGIVSCALMLLPMYFLAGRARPEQPDSRRLGPGRARADHARDEASSAQSAPRFRPSRALLKLIIAYGLMGFGYVITATFIVAMTRKLDTPGLEAWTWVAVGVAGIPSIALWQQFADRFGIMKALRWAYVGLIIGVMCAGLAKSVPMVIVGALLLGGTFMAITSMGLQAARTLAGAHAGLAMGWMTAAFGLGQWLGPAVSGRIAQSSGDFFWPSALAAGLLLISVLLSREER